MSNFIKAQDPLSWLIIIALIGLLIYSIIHDVRIKRRIKSLSDSSVEITPEDFLKLKSQWAGKGRRQIMTGVDYPGVYVLYNNTKRMHYVGQGKKVMARIAQHFTGHGNADVYADWKYGDRFTIKIIKLQGSGFRSLNSLERSTIASYKAFSKGYNKTRGNRG